MRLNKQIKDEIRKQIEEKLQEVPEGNRIHLDRDLLEQLLFDAIYANDNSIILKRPVWSGDFLSKIDLSEISFEDVSWYISDVMRFGDVFLGSNYEELEKKMGEQYIIINQYASKYEKNKTDVVYSNTNADIDFKKSWEYKMVGRVYIGNCNFNGTDLSKNKVQLFNVDDSDLSNTGIQILPGKIYIENTNFEGVDLSAFEIDFNDMVNNFEFNRCNLKNTGIRIVNFSKEVIDYADNEDPEEYGEFLKEQFKKGEFDGCYINGMLIKSAEERKRITEEMRMKYQQIKEEILRNTISNIDEQINEMKK